MTRAPWRLTGRIRVGLPPGEALRLFTPRGEQDWADGWHPAFPAAAPDDSEPGTVFVTDAHGPGHPTVWIVVDRQEGEGGARISYARVTAGDRAGTVTVSISPAGRDSTAEVTYGLTALTDAAEARLREFAAGYADFLRSWEEAIAECLGSRQ